MSTSEVLRTAQEAIDFANSQKQNIGQATSTAIYVVQAKHGLGFEAAALAKSTVHELKNPTPKTRDPWWFETLYFLFNLLMLWVPWKTGEMIINYSGPYPFINLIAFGYFYFCCTRMYVVTRNLIKNERD